MAFQTSTSSVFSFKVMVISTTVLSAAILLKFSAPAITDFAVYEVPSIYNGVVSWLKPPYLYLLINFIIITIVASSKLQSRKDELTPLQVPTMDGGHPQQVAPLPAKSIQIEEYAYNGGAESDSGDVKKQLDFEAFEGVEGTKKQQSHSPLVVNAGDGGAALIPEDATSNKENEYVMGKSSWNAARNECSTVENSPSDVKPPVSARFVHRRSVKASPEGGKTVLGVTKPKRSPTLESTWKTITEGRAIPLNRHLKKSESWEREGHVIRQEKMMGKSATFNNTNTNTPSPKPKVRREPSLSQDELNRRVEAFIKKFNEDMRLQRQESLNQYREMINRGSHY